MDNEDITRCENKLISARMDVLEDNGFYGVLLLHLKLSFSDRHETAWSEDGENFFAPIHHVPYPFSLVVFPLFASPF